MTPKNYDPNDFYNQNDTLIQDGSANFGAQQATGKVLAHQTLTRVPRFLRESAYDDGFISLLYFANSLAGPESASVDINMPFMPQILVWQMGTTDKSGDALVEDGGLILSDFVLGVSGGSGSVSWTRDRLTIEATPFNVGWPGFLTENFYYLILNDDAKLTDYGL